MTPGTTSVSKATRAVALRAIAVAGLTAGILDISAACGIMAARGVGPVLVLQGIASGALGKAAFEGGGKTAFLGLFFHFLIALGAATVFWTATRYLPFLLRYSILSGALFGIAVWLFMNFVVIPLSAIGWRTTTLRSVTIGWTVHMLCIGMPISRIVRCFSQQNTATESP